MGRSCSGKAGRGCQAQEQGTQMMGEQYKVGFKLGMGDAWYPGEGQFPQGCQAQQDSLKESKYSLSPAVHLLGSILP